MSQRPENPYLVNMNTGIAGDGSIDALEQKWAPWHSACDTGVTEMPLGWEICSQDIGENIGDKKFWFFYYNHRTKKRITIQTDPHWVVQTNGNEYWYFNEITKTRVYIVPDGWKRQMSSSKKRPYWCKKTDKNIQFWTLEEVYNYLGYRRSGLRL